MSSPAISVAMSVHDGERFLPAAIESILSQTFGDFEFLIIDDGSRDGSAEIIQRFAAEDQRIVPILQENRGLIASLNDMLARARAPIVARMDADDVSLPDRFARQHDFLRDNPDYGVVGAHSYDIDESGRRCLIPPIEHPITHEQFLSAVDNGKPLMCHPAVMYRRDLVLSVGGYHAAFRHCEDLDLWLRLSSITKLGSLPDTLIAYRRYPAQVSRRHATEQLVGAAVAHLAYRERLSGRPDPTSGLGALPAIDELDALFGREGLGPAVRARVAPSLLYSDQALQHGGLDLIIRHVRDGGDRTGMWRTVARLLKFGRLRSALRLAAALATSSPVPSGAASIPEAMTTG